MIGVSVVEVAQVPLRVVEEPAPVIDHVEVLPAAFAQSPVADLDDLRIVGPGEDGGVGAMTVCSPFSWRSRMS